MVGTLYLSTIITYEERIYNFENNTCPYPFKALLWSGHWDLFYKLVTSYMKPGIYTKVIVSWMSTRLRFSFPLFLFFTSIIFILDILQLVLHGLACFQGKIWVSALCAQHRLLRESFLPKRGPACKSRLQSVFSVVFVGYRSAARGGWWNLVGEWNATADVFMMQS